jgi:hypothetical protein
MVYGRSVHGRGNSLGGNAVGNVFLTAGLALFAVVAVSADGGSLLSVLIAVRDQLLALAGS